MKNILYKPLCELYSLYKKSGYSEDWFIEYMYSGIAIYAGKNREERIYVVINQSYYYTIFCCMLHYLHYDYEDRECDEEYKNIINELKEKYNQNITRITFEQLREDGLYDKVKQTITWVIRRMNYVFDELGKIDINTFGKKEKFETMLDEL